MPWGKAPTPPSDEVAKPSRTKHYLEQVKTCQKSSVVMLVLVIIVVIVILVLASNQTAQIGNVSDELKNIEQQLEEQKNQKLNANETPLPTKKGSVTNVLCKDSRFANLTELVLLSHDFASDLAERGNLISNRWVCNDENGYVTPGITVNSHPFKTIQNEPDEQSAFCEHRDNKKFFCATRNMYLVSNTTRAIRFDALWSGQTFCTPRDKLVCANDPRVASAVFSTWDDENGIENSILMTNTTLYAFHSKELPARAKEKKTHSSKRVYIYPIFHRPNPLQKHRVALVYTKHSLGFWSVAFDVDDHHRLTLYHLGRDQQPGFQTLSSEKRIPDVEITPKRISVGFGTFSYMQMKFPGQENSVPYFAFPCANVSGESLYGDANVVNGTNIFLQGAKMSLETIEVKEYR